MKSINKIQFIVIILLILLILYLSVNNMEKFTVTPASSSEAIANIASMYNNSKLTATTIDTTGNINSQAKLCINNVCIDKEQLTTLTSMDIRRMLPGASFYRGGVSGSVSGENMTTVQTKHVGECVFSLSTGKYIISDRIGGWIWYMSVNPGYNVQVYKNADFTGTTSIIRNFGNLPLLINLYTMTILNNMNGADGFLPDNDINRAYINPTNREIGDPGSVQVWVP